MGLYIGFYVAVIKSYPEGSILNIEEPEEGVLIFFNSKPPYLLVIRGRDRKYKIYNWVEVVRVECLEDTRV
jgi:hypothetical protein